MAQELYTRTNQKLYFAGLALEAWKRADAERAMNAQAIIQGERESHTVDRCREYRRRSPLAFSRNPRGMAAVAEAIGPAFSREPDGAVTPSSFADQR